MLLISYILFMLFVCLVLFVCCCCLVFSRTSAEVVDPDGSKDKIKQEMADLRRNLIFRLFVRVGRARGN
jgi:hypothetical protein